MKSIQSGCGRGRCGRRHGRRFAAGIARLVPGFLLLLPGAAAAGVVTSLSAIPSPFSPDGDGILDRTTIYAQINVSVDSLRLAVGSDSGTESWSMTLGALTAGSYGWTWDGRTSGGEVFSDGVHRLTVVAYIGGAAADSVDRRISTDVFAPRIVDFEQIRSSFAPDADLWNLTGLRFGIETGGPAADTTRVRILNAAGTLVRTLGGFGGALEDTLFHWNGRNASDVLATEGSYFFEVRASDEAGNEDVQVGQVFLDKGAPSIGVLSDTVFAVAFPETVRGWAFDPSGVAAVSFREVGGAWVETATSGGDSVAWEYALGDTSDPDGWYAVYGRARDVFGHAADSVRVTVGKAARGPIHVGSDVSGGDTVLADGDEVVIESRWDRPGYTLAASFLEVDSKYTTGMEQVTDNGDGTYQITYTISATNTRQNAVGLPIRIKASHVYYVDSAFVYVELRNDAPSVPPVEVLTLDRNLFNPDRDEQLVLSFPSAAARTFLDIYTVMGERVWSRDVGGQTSAVWDGHNSEGDIVASGVYLVRLGGTVRKVGVIK